MFIALVFISSIQPQRKRKNVLLKTGMKPNQWLAKLDNQAYNDTRAWKENVIFLCILT